MFRNLSDLGPRIKKKVSYSNTAAAAASNKSCSSDETMAETTNYQRSSLDALPTFSITHYSAQPPLQCLPYQTSVSLREEEEEERGNADQPTTTVRDVRSPTDYCIGNAAPFARTQRVELGCNRLDSATAAVAVESLELSQDLYNRSIPKLQVT